MRQVLKFLIVKRVQHKTYYLCHILFVCLLTDIECYIWSYV